MTKTLLVGCGGTGIKTLKSFNRLMSGDSERRYRLWEDVSYLVIDTNKNDINEFEADINSEIGSGSGREIGPVVETMHITEDNRLLNSLVQTYMVKSTDEEYSDKLRKHWWYSPDHHPFTAIHRRNTGDGAAQCPPISYAFIWEKMPELETKIKNILRDIAARNSDQGMPFKDFRVFIVAGLAGGTGRGTWNLVAFKVRQCIKEFLPNAQVDLPAIFLDSSCYSTLYPNDATQQLCKRVNAITGVSELSAWLSVRDELCYNYTLPALIRPEAQKTHAALSSFKTAIQVDTRDGDPYAQSPVRYAYMVYGENGRFRLYVDKSRNEYCEMAGAALYALVAHAANFDGDKANGMPKYCSFGAATAEVDTVKLRMFFNAMLRRIRMKSYYDELSEESANEYLRTLRTDNRLRQNRKVDDELILGMSSDVAASTDIVERIMGRALSSIEGQVRLKESELKGSLFETQKHLEVWQRMLGVIGLSTIKSDVVDGLIDEELSDWADSLRKDASLKGNAALDEYLLSGEEKVCETPMSRYLWELICKAYHYKGRPSISRALICIRHLMDEFDKVLHSMPALNDCRGELERKCKEFSENQSFLFDRTTMEFFPDPYNAKEKSALTKLLIKTCKLRIYSSIVGNLNGKLKSAISLLEKWKTVLITIKDELDATARIYKNNANRDCTGSETGSAYDELFVGTDDDVVDASIPPATVTAERIRRVFKPIMDNGGIEDVLSDKDVYYSPTDKINKFVKEKMCQLFAKKGAGISQGDRKVIQTELYNLFNEVTIKPDQLDAKFTMEAVLERNIPHWNRVLAYAHTRGKDFEDDLKNRLRAYLGLRDGTEDTVTKLSDYSVTDDGIPFITLERVKCRLPVSLMSVCTPWVNFDKVKEPRLGVENLQKTILLPYMLTGDKRREMAANVKKGTELEVAVIDSSDNRGVCNPADRIVAFSSLCAPVDLPDNRVLDSILSYQEDLRRPEVLDFLTAADTKEGLGYFLQNSDGKYIERHDGCGFVSPVFVTEKELVERRWKPWKSLVDAEEAKKRNDNFVYELLAYAFTGSGIPANSPLTADIKSEHWSFPLLSRTAKARTKKSGKFVFVRKALGMPDGDVCEWEENDGLPCTGISQIVSWLLGKGLANSNGDIDERVTNTGRAVFRRLVAEKEFFEKNVIPRVKPSIWEEILKLRSKWLAAEASTKDKILDRDREAWKRILAAAAQPKPSAK